MKRVARVFHASIHGTRAEKYIRLEAADLLTTEWTRIGADGDYYLFVPQAQAYAGEYGSAVSVRSIFVADSVGVVTARDRLTIHLDREKLLTTVKEFAGMDEESARSRYKLGKDARDWKVALAQRDIRSQPISDDWVRQILYRPFDARLTFYTGRSRGFIGQPQQRVANQMHPRDNLGLCVARALEIKTGWQHVFCSKIMIQHHAVSLKEVNYLFPLYLYTDGNVHDLFGGSEVERAPNPAFIAVITDRLGMTFVPNGTGDLEATVGPEDIFHYMYAVFHSPIYRERYAEFLKIDFPRLPLTTDPALFRGLCAHGAELTALHLMEAHAPLITRYPIPGDNTVDKPRYTTTDERVWINANQYFEGVPETVWEHRVGGYQVAEKWLKDRQDRALTYDDLTHYQRTVAALARTRDLMDEIDKTIERRGGWPLVGSVGN